VFGGGGPVTCIQFVIRRLVDMRGGLVLPGCSFAREMSDFAGLFSYPP
jgi:hypothetical protein